MDSTEGSLKRKTMKKATNNTKLDDALYLWFSQKLSQGVPISGPLVMAKVKFQFFKKFMDNLIFRTS